MTDIDHQVLKRVAKFLNTADAELAEEFAAVLEGEPIEVVEVLFELLQTEV